jgi:hypothetical protein
VKKGLLFLPLLGCLALSGEPIKFIQPKRAFIMASPSGVELWAQVRIEPSANNRSYTLVWPGGSTSRELDGEDAPATQESVKVRLFPGEQHLIAVVFGPGEKELSRVDYKLTVCGGMDGDCVPQQ